MKKYIYILSVFLLFSLSLFSEEKKIPQYGQLSEIKDTVTNSDKNGIIISHIKGKTDKEGVIAIPSPSKSEVKNVKIVKGTKVEELKKVTYGDTKFYTVKFAEMEKDVELEIEFLQENTYELKKAKQKGTYHGDIKTQTFKFKNSAPIGIKKYILQFNIPKDYELYSIVDYDPEEHFTISAENHVKYGENVFEKLDPGKEVKLQINLYKPGKIKNILIWAVALIIGLFYMYKDKDSLKLAKEVKNNLKG